MIDARKENQMSVTLWSGRLPYLGVIADHNWLVINNDGQQSRWEVWQSKNAGGTSWGHLHLDLMAAEDWIARQPPVLHQTWYNENARRIIERVESSPEIYPWRELYRYWPGPNSNTYVQWALGEQFRLSWRAAGRRYVRFA